MPNSPKWSIPLRFSNQNFVCISNFPHHATCPIHLTLLVELSASYGGAWMCCHSASMGLVMKPTMPELALVWWSVNKEYPVEIWEKVVMKRQIWFLGIVIMVLFGDWRSGVESGSASGIGEDWSYFSTCEKSGEQSDQWFQTN
jgi:hypothetical protein